MLHKSHEEECVLCLCLVPRKAPVERGACQLSLLDARYPSLLAAVIRQGNQDLQERLCPFCPLLKFAPFALPLPPSIACLISFATQQSLEKCKYTSPTHYHPFVFISLYRGHLYNRVWHYFLVFGFLNWKGIESQNNFVWISFVALFQGSCLSFET